MKIKIDVNLNCRSPQGSDEITNRLSAIEEKLDTLLADTDNIREELMALQNQLEQLSEKTDALGVAVAEVAQAQTDNDTALTAEIVEVQDALKVLTNDNPQLATALNNLDTRLANVKTLADNTRANTEKIKNIIVTSPIVPSVQA